MSCSDPQGKPPCTAIVSALVSAFLLLSGAAASGVTLYVATNGNDSWSGTLDSPNGGRSDGPFLTPFAAQTAVRHLIAGNSGGDIRVQIRSGTYALSTPLRFDARDAPGGIAVSWEAYPAEAPILSGGIPVTNWEPHASISNLWQAVIPDVSSGIRWFNQLYVDDERAVRARFPNPGSGDLRVTAVSPDTRQITLDRGWGGEDLTGKTAELFVYHEWSCSRSLISTSAATQVASDSPAGVLNFSFAITKVYDYAYLEHAFSFLDLPGEWFLDRNDGRLYLMLTTGENPSTLSIVTPAITNLLQVRGSGSQPVRGLRFNGLTFEHSLWNLPPGGLPEIQASHLMPDWHEGTTYLPPVAIEFEYAEGCRMENCRVAHTGAGGIAVGAGCISNAIVSCDVYDSGANAIDLGWRGRINPDSSLFTLAEDWQSLADIPKGNVLSDNSIHHAGQYLAGSAGIWTAFTRDSLLSHNDVRDLPGAGLSIGFSWAPVLTSQQRCGVEFNSVSAVVQRMADSGGIYLLGAQPGTTVRNNLVSDITRHPDANGSPLNAFYLDNGSSNLQLTANLAFRITGNAFFCRPGELAWNDIHNNVFGNEPTFTDELFYWAGVGTRPGETPPPWRNEPPTFTLDFNDWPPGVDLSTTRSSWSIENATVATAPEPCLGNSLVLSSSNASLTSLTITGNMSSVELWLCNETPGTAVLDISTRGLEGEWAIKEVFTNTSTTWKVLRRSWSETELRQVRIRLLNPGQTDNAIRIDNMIIESTTPADASPPSIDEIRTVGRRLSPASDVPILLSAHDASSVRDVTVAGQPCTYLGNRTWSGSAPVSGETTSVNVVAMDGAGHSKTQLFAFASGTRYVAPTGTAIAPFDTWAKAATNIQDAIDAAHPGDTVFVSNGVYTTGFKNIEGLKNRVAITSDIAVVSMGAPSNTVIVGSGPLATASSVRGAYLSAGLLAGFTISNGTTMLTSEALLDSLGGGVFLAGHATLSNCIVSSCTAYRGGGLYIRDQALVDSCSIISNTSVAMGGGINAILDPVIRNSVIIGNHATSWGGGILCDYGTTTLIGCLLSGNSALDGGGAFLIQRTRLFNCTVTGNTALSGGAGLSTYSAAEATVVNTIIYSNFIASTHSNVSIFPPGNIQFIHCCTWPLPAGSHECITNAPAFASPDTDRLNPASPCIDAGESQYVLDPADRLGNPRIVREVDIGSTELEPQESPPGVWLLSTPALVTYDSAQLCISGSVNAAVIGNLVISNLTTLQGYSFPSKSLWVSPPIPLATGINSIVVQAFNSESQSATSQASIIRTAPGTGLPVIQIDSLPAYVPSTVDTINLSGTHDGDVVGVMTASNAANSSLSPFTTSGNHWTTPLIPLIPASSNRVYIVGTNSTGIPATAMATVVRCQLPFLSVTGVPPVLPFISTECSLAGTNTSWTCGWICWTNSLAARTGQGFASPGNLENICRDGIPSAHYLGFASANLAFDGDENTAWYPSSSSNGWIKYDVGYGNNRRVTSLDIKPFVTNSSIGIGVFKLQGSSDDRAWNDLLCATQSSEGWSHYATTNEALFRWYRLWIETSGSNGIGIAEARMNGSPAWHLDPISVDVGTNGISVIGTNAAGEAVTQVVQVIRSFPDNTDHDDDGSSDLEEWLAGTDPSDPRSALCFLQTQPDSSGAVLRWQSATNRSYDILWGTSLFSVLTPIATDLHATPPENAYTDSLHQSDSPLFYRIRLR